MTPNKWMMSSPKLHKELKNSECLCTFPKHNKFLYHLADAWSRNCLYCGNVLMMAEWWQCASSLIQVLPVLYISWYKRHVLLWSAAAGYDWLLSDMNSPSSEVDGWLMREKWRALVLSDLLVYVRYKKKTICRWQDNWCTSNMIFLWWWASLFLQCHDVAEVTCCTNKSMSAGTDSGFFLVKKSLTCSPPYVQA